MTPYMIFMVVFFLSLALNLVLIAMMIAYAIARVHKHLKLKRAPQVQKLILSINGLLKNKGVPMYQLKDAADQVVYAIAKELDQAGNVISVAPDAPPVWTVSDATLATITPAADGMSATILPVGPLGAFKVQVSAMFGGKAILASDDIQVVASGIASIVIAPVVPAAAAPAPAAPAAPTA